MIAGMLSFIFLTGCNAGVNLTVPSTPTAESSGLENGGTDPVATPTPSATPPTTIGKNRIFVSTKLVTAINAQDGNYFNLVCAQEAKKAKLSGKFVALIANGHEPFTKNNTVSGYIYQKSSGAEVRVADDIHHLIAGKNEAIDTNAFQQNVDNSYKNYAWTGQNNFNQPASPDLNCADWKTDQGYGIVGLVGARGSDALASRYQGCHITARLYCIEINN